MDKNFENWIMNYKVRNGKQIREKYAKQILLYLSNIQNDEKIDLDEEYDKDLFTDLINRMEDKVVLGIKNKNTENGDRVALNKYIEFKQINCSKPTTK